MRRTIKVVPYDPQWPDLFSEEAEDLKDIFGMEIVAVHHVGSTAIPGIRAKPIIDVLVVVRHLSLVDCFNEEMRARGYIPKGEFGIAGRRFFIKGTETERTHHLHIFESSHPAVEGHVAFRDYLRAHPEAAQAYGDLKTELAKDFRRDIENYMAGKDALVKEIERKAIAWKRRGE